MSQLSHAEDASFSHEGEDSVTATEGEWVRAHPSYTKIRLIQVVGFFYHAGRRFCGADCDV